jgi:hypothetical protein
VIEKLDADSINYGISNEIIRHAVLYPASSAKFQISDSAHTNLYVNIDSLVFKSADLCVTHIQMQAFAFQEVTLDFSGKETMATVELWSQGGIVSTNRAAHSRHVTQLIEDIMKRFVTDWNIDNKAPTGLGTPLPAKRP